MPRNYRRYKRGRTRGTSVVYTPQQTERYQSQFLRYQKAVEKLKGDDMILFEESPLRARFKSKRSPVGYWEVAGLNATLSGTLATTADSARGTVAGQFVNESPWEIEYPEPPFLDDQFTWGGSFFSPPPDISYFAASGVINSLLVDSGDIQWRTLYFFTGSAFTGSVTASLKINGNTVSSETFSASVGNQVDFIGSYGVVEAGEELSVDYEQTFTLTSGTRLFPLQPALWLSNVFEVANVSGCNCPDKTKQVAANPQSPYLSEQVDRDWTASNAGTPDKCWHEWAVEILTNPNIQIPTDVPELR